MDADGLCVCEDDDMVTTGVDAVGDIACVPQVAVSAVAAAGVGSASSVTFYDVDGSSTTVSQSGLMQHYYTRAAAMCVASFVASAGAIDMRFPATMALSAAGDSSALTRTPPAFAAAGSQPSFPDRSWQGGPDRGCQLLTNLCAMTLYDGNHAACELAVELADRQPAGVNDWSGWHEGLPFTYHSSAAAIAQSEVLSQQMSFDSGTQAGTQDTLLFLVVKYALEGRVLGVERLSDQLSPCGAQQRGPLASSSSPAYFKFGVSHSSAHSCDLRQLLLDAPGDEDEGVLFEVFYVDFAAAEAATGSGVLTAVTPNSLASDLLSSAVESFPTFVGTNASLPRFLYPVPVRITNLRTSSGTYPNRNPTTDREGDDQLVRRFPVVDRLSGVQGTARPLMQSQPRVVRFLREATLIVKTQDGSRDTLAPPLLELTYGERLADRILSDHHLVEYTFRVRYREEFADGFKTTAVVLFVIAQTVGVIAAAIRWCNWQNRSIRDERDRLRPEFSVCMQAGQLLAELCGSFSVASATVVTLLSLYWLLFYKLQDRVFALLPEDNGLFARNPYNTLRAFLWAMWATQTAWVIYLIGKQSASKIFFLDWETVKPGDGDLQEQADAEAAAGGGGGAGVANRPAADRQRRQVMAKRSVSAWRTLFVANEWQEYLPMRRANPALTLLLMVLILEFAGEKYVATPQPDVKDHTAGSLNPLLLFAIVIWWYAALAGAQWLLMEYVVERFLDQDPVQRFIDRCTAAKVSLLAIDHRYRAFYLHCNASIEYADGDMRQLLLHLKEEDARGRMLPDAPKPLPTCDGEPGERQSYELFLSREWRLTYDTIMSGVVPEHHQGRSGFNGGGAGAADGSWLTACLVGLFATASDVDEGAVNRAQAVYNRMNQFLVGFFLQSSAANEGHQYSFMAGSGKTQAQRFFGFVPERAMQPSFARDETSQSWAVLDQGVSMTGLAFRGIELHLLLLDVLVFTLVMQGTGSAIPAALTVWLVDWLLADLRVRWGRYMLSQSALIHPNLME